jgi:nucleoside-diphosphate-sugar epimerase
MKIWITGSAGFLGGRLYQQLLADGHEVVGISRRTTNQANAYAIDLANDSSVETLASIRSNIGPPDVVIHTASRQPGLKGELPAYVKSNLKTTSNLVAALRDSPPRQLIYTSTLSVYSRPSTNPVDESAPAGGQLPYSATKRWAEEVIENAHDFPSRLVLRLPSLFGKGQDDSFIDGLARVAMRNEPIELFGQGKLIRDALHVSDVVAAIQSVINNPPGDKFVSLNLGCGRSLTTQDWAEALVEAMGSTSEIELTDRAVNQFDLYANIERARSTIGFCPTELRESLKRYADELRA